MAISLNQYIYMKFPLEFAGGYFSKSYSIELSGNFSQSTNVKSEHLVDMPKPPLPWIRYAPSLVAGQERCNCPGL